MVVFIFSGLEINIDCKHGQKVPTTFTLVFGCLVLVFRGMPMLVFRFEGCVNGDQADSAFFPNSSNLRGLCSNKHRASFNGVFRRFPGVVELMGIPPELIHTQLVLPFNLPWIGRDRVFETLVLVEGNGKPSKKSKSPIRGS